MSAWHFHEFGPMKMGSGCVVCGKRSTDRAHTGEPDIEPQPLPAIDLDALVKELESDPQHPAWDVRSAYSR